MDFEDMSEQEIVDIIDQGKQELIRRQNTTLLGDRLAQVQDEFRDAGILAPTSTHWVESKETADAYGRGDVVDWDSGQRQATAGFVVCSPDCPDHWTDYVEPEEEPETEEPEPELPETIDWSTGATLTTGTRVAYQDHTYTATRTHIASDDRTPDTTPSLYQEA